MSSVIESSTLGKSRAQHHVVYRDSVDCKCCTSIHEKVVSSAIRKALPSHVRNVMACVAGRMKKQQKRLSKKEIGVHCTRACPEKNKEEHVQRSLYLRVRRRYRRRYYNALADFFRRGGGSVNALRRD